MSREKSQPETEQSSLYRPQKRERDLVITELNGEVLVYDEQVHHIHHLKAGTAAVWQHCDGERTIKHISQEMEISFHAVRLALRELEHAVLLQQPLPAAIRGTESRRQLLKKVGIASIPAIISITAPIAKAAASYPDPGGDLCYKAEHCPPNHWCDYQEAMLDLPGTCIAN